MPVDSYGQTFKFVEQAEENQRKKKLLQQSVGSDVALQIKQNQQNKHTKLIQKKDEEKKIVQDYNQMMSKIESLNKERQDQYRVFVQKEIEIADKKRRQKQQKQNSEKKQQRDYMNGEQDKHNNETNQRKNHSKR